MGHLLSSKSSLVPLIDRLNRYPIGLVDSEKLREILSILFSEDEAFIASRFPLQEATLEELVELTGLDEAVLYGHLESMANKGLVMDLPYSGKTYYLLMPGLIGFMEFTFMRKREDLPMEKLAKLMADYLQENGKQGQAGEFFGSKTQLTRALVHKEHIPTHSTIASYEDAQQIIRESEFTAVTHCYCRHKKEHQGKECRKGAPVEETCMVLGEGARFLVRRGFAHEKSKQEMLQILDRAKSLNLTHVTDNIRDKPSFICNCCRCCCELMAGVQMGFEEGLAKTPFIAVIDEEKCDYCGECLKTCNVKCIGLSKGREIREKSDRRARIDEKVCLGCGACIPVCEKEAITLVPRQHHRRPPKNKGWMFARILWEKGRLAPFVVSKVKHVISPFKK